MEKSKSLSVDEIPKELTSKEFANSDDILAATEPISLMSQPCNDTWSPGASPSRKWWRGWRWYDRNLLQ